MGATAASVVYEIHIQGHLDGHRARQFHAMTVTPHADGLTVLMAPVADQAALHGLLGRIRDLGIPLLLVRRVDTGVDAGVDAGVDVDRNMPRTGCHVQDSG